MTRTCTALVIGGGIAGPVAAMALHKAGIDATVYEAYHDTATGIGGALSTAPNGMDALGAVGAADAVRRIGDPMTAIVLESWTGKRLAELRTPPDLPPMLLAWRFDLYRALHQEAVRRDIPTVYGKRLVNAEDTGDGVTAHFADGTTARGDVLIGADGIRSTTRGTDRPGLPAPPVHRTARVRRPDQDRRAADHRWPDAHDLREASVFRVWRGRLLLRLVRQPATRRAAHPGSGRRDRTAAVAAPAGRGVRPRPGSCA